MTTLAFPDTAGKPTDGSFTYEANGVIYSWTGDYWAANNAQGFDHRYVNVDGDQMTGDLTVPSLNGGPLAGMRNVLINGDFRIWQRSIDATATGYATADRWHQWTTLTTPGAAAPRVARDAGIAGQFSYSARVINTSSADTSRLEQGIELGRAGDASPFAAGSTWTLSYYATAPQTVFNLAFFDNVFPGDNSAGNQPDPGEVELEDLGGGWKRYSRTITIAGGPAGSNLCLRLALGASNPCDYKISGIQLESGPVATPFEMRPIGLELQLCQRYYQLGSNITMFSDNPTATQSRQATYQLPVEMRVPPTVEWNRASGSATIEIRDPTTRSLRWYTSNASTTAAAVIGFKNADAEL